MSLRVPEEALRELARRVLEASGAHAAQAAAVADVLVWSDLVGRDSQGVWRLPILSERLRRGGILGAAEPRFEQQAPSAGTVHGGGGAGHHVARVAMDHAIRIASEQGVGAVRATRSNYLGATAYYVWQAACAGMIGMASSNSFPKVLAHGGQRAALGTNPIAFGAPMERGEAFVLDMATSAAAGSTVRRAQEAGAQLDPAVLANGALLPFGGAKGYGMAVLVEVLCGVLAGPGFAQGVRSMYEEPAAVGDNGHLMLAIDVRRFMPLETFHARMAALASWLESTGAPGVVRIPGTARWQARRENEARGIPLAAKTADALARLCAELGLDAPSFLAAAKAA